jgi:cyanophycinase
MSGYLLLEGGAEFGGQMAVPDRRAIELAGGPNSLITIIPTAAAPDNNHLRAGRNGVSWFQSLGAHNVELLPLIDKASANNSAIAARISQSRLVYMLGGFTGYLGETLANSASYRAMLQAYESGAIIAGSSAGAMVMCQYYSDPGRGQIVEGLRFVLNACVLPHHNTFGKNWAQRLSKQLPNAVLLGIDERTGMLDDGNSRNGERKTAWSVYGQGAVTIYRSGRTTVYEAGDTFIEDFQTW